MLTSNFKYTFYKVLVLIFFAPYAAFTEIQSQVQEKIAIRNRVLVKVNDKSISVLDVVKKMDVFLARYHPQVLESSRGKYHYYVSQWRAMLNQMIENELILADAEKLELKISDAEVRESLLERFGPNVMSSLNRLQMSYEEAKEMIKTELSVEKMTWYRIHSKALRQVNPQDIKKAYSEYLAATPALDTWHYRVLSIKSQDEIQAKMLAEKAHALTQNGNRSLDSIATSLQQELADPSAISITVSDELTNTSKTISSSHKQVLLSMAVSSISEPIRQLNKANKEAVFRIFQLNNKTTQKPKLFAQVAEELKNSLIERAVAEEHKAYMEKIKSKLGYDAKSLVEEVPQEFQPFSLQ